MKKFIFLVGVLFAFLFVPVSAFAEESLGDFKFDPKKSSHPLDMVNSKGEVIKYEDYSQKSTSLRNETESFKGSGELNPVFIGDLLNKDFQELLPPSINDNFIKREISPFGVIGPDGRSKVNDTTVFPYSAVTYITMDWADGDSGSCTGTLIARDKVLTNGHCVVNARDKVGIVSAAVHPGVSESTAWFGAYSVIDYYVPTNWINTGLISEDYAVLVLAPSGGRHAGDRAGFAGIRKVNNILNQNIGVFGYPGDLIREARSIDQYGMRGNVVDEDGQIAIYTLDTADGQSGSAMLNTSNQVIGVHSSGFKDNNGNPIFNGGPKMNNLMYQFVSNALN